MIKNTSPLVSLALNVYNEEKNIDKIYKECKSVFKKAKIPYEIIFIEGGSSDNSWKILQNLAKNNKDVKVIQAEMGPGQKINAGIKAAKGKYFGYMCSDGQDNPNVIPQFIKLLEEKKADFVKGRRVERDCWQRKFISRVYNRLAGILFGLNLTDINMHPKVFRRELVKGVNLISRCESVDLEIVLRAHKKGYKIVEIPVRERMRKGGKSSVNIKVALKMFLDILSYKWGSKNKALRGSMK
ncbi:glycosyltransferase family 2 protein [Patescibacteria group bacterium]|nr:glycosyltransferase family 2 protein [Patescibacteria group bacterium]MBU4017063.1 glycosyltransferase family 2 protein [Patescibacteria group bacterium]MBU4099393.1 glycosyltransferase family 2 protein [Patescibacteria group bacterium]